jgi:Protein of unknown function (DUF1566)/Repeat of unknown function (DUF5648)
MTHFSKKTIPAILFAALLSACGGQSTTDSATTSTVQKTAQTSQAASILSPASSADLLTSLAVTYPNGQIPPANAAQAAKELAQNPAALHLTAQFTAKTAQSAATPIQSQAVAADYKAVTRIQNTTLTGAYFFTIYDTEQAAALAGNPNWKLEGAAFWASLASGTGLNPVHRFRNNLNGSYLYTIYAAEKTEIEANYASTFTYEGVAWYAQQTPGAGWSPLYRFRNLLNGTYLFSAYEAEKDAIVANYSAVFKLEGVAYYVRQDAPPPNNDFSFIANGSGGYYDKTECVKDSVTGLVWEGKPTSGLRMWNDTYTNYDSTTALQIYVYPGPAVAPTLVQVNATTNSVGYKNAVNASNLCGFSDWRIPTKDELLALVRPNTRSYPPFATIDNYWFPNTNNWSYISSTPVVHTPAYADDLRYAWGVWFNYGDARETDYRRSCCSIVEGHQNIRLVR